jgi:hypothetical protein
VISWEQAVSKQLRVLHLESIRNKLLAFALLATLIPSCSTAWVSYTQNKRSLGEKITGQLQSVSSETAREIDLWLKERLYDLRVFASSYEVSENLDPKAKPGRHALTRLNDYLTSVRERFSDYEQLIVMDATSRAVATSASRAGPVHLPENWLNDVRANSAALGNPYWDEARARVVMIAAVPIRLAHGQFIGSLATKLTHGGHHPGPPEAGIGHTRVQGVRRGARRGVPHAGSQVDVERRRRDPGAEGLRASHPTPK